MLSPYLASPLEVRFGETASARCIRRVDARYGRELGALEGLGFRRLGTYDEIALPFTVLRQRGIARMMKEYGEVLSMRWPLRRTVSLPAFAHEEARAFAYVFGLGTVFLTETAAGWLVSSASWSHEDIELPALKYLRAYEPVDDEARDAVDRLREALYPGDSPAAAGRLLERRLRRIGESWQAHRERVTGQDADSLPPRPAEGFDVFFALLHREQEAMEARPPREMA